MFKKILLSVVIVLLLTAGVFGLVFRSLKHNITQNISDSQGLTNILILGINGNGGADADLTDTIAIATLNPSFHQGSVITLPRDLWVESLKAKINTAYHYGGLDLAKQTVTEITGLPIHYYLIVDFNDFQKVIDAVGGITVEVENSFEDPLYPLAGQEKNLCNGDPQLKCRYETIRFNAGKQRMDGATALKFVRSRHAIGDEGTDFARSARQTLVIRSLVDELTQPERLLHPISTYRLGQQLLTYLKTDIQINQYGNFLQLASLIDWSAINHITIPDNLLETPKKHYSKQWVITPKDASWKEIRNYFRQSLHFQSI